MSSHLQDVGVKLLSGRMEQYAPPDPVYEYYTDERGKQRRRKRDVPPGISERDAKILKKVQSRARFLDKSFSFCGLRFGWTFIIGIVPGAGDAACAALNYYLVIRKAKEADLPSSLIGKMVFNNVVSAVGGLVPVLGDIVIAVYKANSRNAILLEEYLRVRGQENLKLQADMEVLEGVISRSESEGITQNNGEQVEPGPVGKESQTGWSFGSFLSRKGKSPDGDRGRFVEDIKK